MMNTYFEHPNNVTFVSQNKEESKCTLDMISVSQSIKSSIVDCEVVDDGIKSDHSAVCMLWENCSSKYSNNLIARGKSNPQEL